ncbi:DUF4214 domain-containing protein [Massilia sp. TN1-12]|uniref:DUF4214 domain-containing protein n=1 Tax=Massilia paldalensis TaxID=3377675 RepID=UPI00384EA5CD
MATTYYNDIQKLYVAYFNRPADPAGLAYWETVVEGAKGSTAAVSASFAASAEYKAAYANMTNTQIVTAVYQNLFGHAPDAAGLKYWADLLDAKTTTIDAVVTNIAGGAQGTDLTAYNNKVTAATAFTAAVDTDAEKAGYTGDAANKIAKAFLAGVTDNLSLQAATGPTALNTTVASAVSAGTAFSVAGALAQLNTANKAITTFVQGVDVDSNPATTTVAADITAAKATALTKVAGDLAGGAAGTSGALFTADTTTQSVRDALVSAQQAINSAALNSAQATVTADNAAIAKVTGLGDAASTLAATLNVQKAAVAAEVTTRADISAKEVSFGISNSGTTVKFVAAVPADNTTTPVTPAKPAMLQFDQTVNGTTTTVTLATIGTDGTATVNSALKASDFTGLTELIASYNAEVNAQAAVVKAGNNVTDAQLAVNLLDLAPATVTNNGTTTDVKIAVTGATTKAYNGSFTEADLISKIVTVINTTLTDSTKIAAGTTPTVAQINTALAVTGAATDQTAFKDLTALVNAEKAASGATYNPLTAKLTADTAAVDNATKAISTLAKDVAALQSASANADTLAGLQATAAAYTKVLTDKGYVVTNLDATHTSNFATAASDIYVVNPSQATASIGAFGLQGTDSVFVGSGYTLVKGAIGATGVTGNNAALEVFVSSSNGNTILQVENHAYSSSVVGGTGEIVTITLTGVDASTIKMDASGIITSGTATA